MSNSRSSSRDRTGSGSSDTDRKILHASQIKTWDEKTANKHLLTFMLAVARVEEKFDRDVRGLNRELLELKTTLDSLTHSVHEACVALQAQGLRTTAEKEGEQAGSSSSSGGPEPTGQEQPRRLSSLEEEAPSDDSNDSGGPTDHIAMLQGLPQMEPFTGEGNEPFSQWLRRFNDYAEAHEKPWSEDDKLRKLKAYLGGGPREKWDEFTPAEKATFAAASEKLKSLYENSFSKDLAKMNLSRCRHRAGESINDFVERLRKLVKAATIGSTTELFKDRFLEEFLDRLDDEIGFHVKAISPKNMEEAVCQAMRFEGLLEARKQKLSAEDQVGQIAARVIAAINFNEGPQNGQSGNTLRDQPSRPSRVDIECHYCGKMGHIRRDCRLLQSHNRGSYRGNNRGRGTGGYRGGYGQQRQNQNGSYRYNGGNGRQGGSYSNSYGSGYGNSNRGVSSAPYRDNRNYSQGRNAQYSNDWRVSGDSHAPTNQGRSESRDRGRYNDARAYDHGARHDRSNSRERPRNDGDRNRASYERRSGSQDRVYSVETVPTAQDCNRQDEVQVPKPEQAPCNGCERLKQINKKIEKAANLSEERPDFVFAITEERADFLEWRKSILAKKRAEGPHPDVSDEDSKEKEELDFRYFKRKVARNARSVKQAPYPASKPRKPLKSILKSAPSRVNVDIPIRNLEARNFVKLRTPPTIAPLYITVNIESTPSKKNPNKSRALSLGSVVTGAILMLLWLMTNAKAEDAGNEALLCHGRASSSLWRIPHQVPCPKFELDRRANLENTSLTILRPNTIEYEVPAWVCKVMKESAKLYTNMAGKDFPKDRVEEGEVVSPIECQQMMRTKSCKHGPLSQVGMMWRTSNPLDLTSPGFWSWGWYERSTVNCFLYETKVYAKFGNQQVRVPLGEAEECRYSQGICNLRTGEAIVWEPVSEQKCRFIPAAKLKGQRLGNTWLADSKEFALSFPESSDREPIDDCGRRLVRSHQGYAVPLKDIEKVKRVKRETQKDEVGVVYSNQLAASMQALELGIVDSIKVAFMHTLMTLCDVMSILHKQLLHAAMSEPTLAARTFLKRPSIQAKAVAENTLEVWPCVAVPRGKFRFRNGTETGKCYEFPPVEIQYELDRIEGFVDPVTRIVSRTSKSVPCDLVKRQTVILYGTVYEVDQKAGTAKEVSADVINDITLDEPMHAEHPEVAVTIFRNMMMVNISEVFPSSHFDEMAHAWHIQEAITKGGQKQTGTPGGVTTGDVGSGILHFILFVIPWWEIFTGGTSTAYVLEKLLFVAAWLLERRIRRRLAQRNQLLLLEETGSWPPPPKVTRRHSEQPDRVNMATVGKGPVAQVIAQVNDVHMISLIDSGSTLTVTGIEVANVLGISPIPFAYGAVAVSGDTLDIVGYADVKVTLGNLTRKARIAFTSNEHLLGDTPYDILIGTDTLERFPRCTMDFERRELSIGDCVLKLTGRNDKLRQPVAVRMAETIEIPAYTEELVRCHVMAVTESKADAFYVEQTDARLLEKGLVLTPSLVHRTSETYLLVSNFSEEGVRLYAGMRVATALNAEEEDGAFRLHEDRINFIHTKEQEEEHDPAYVVDIDSCEITDEQKAIFVEVLEEYDDVFSRHAWDIGCCKVEPAEIRTTTDVPITARPFRVPPKLLPHLKSQIAKMKKHDVLKDSDTAWVSNLVPVRKATGEIRLCVDLRKLNAVSVPSRYPIPRVEKLIEKLSDSTYFSTCDMTAGFFQIGLSEEASEKFGIILEDEVFQFTRLPFGHVNSTAIFGRAMAVVFEGLTGILTYVDDILCYSKEPEFEAHLLKLREMFQRLRDFDMKLKPQKCKFFQTKVTYLGLTISKVGYGPAEKNVEAIRSFPAPTDLKKVKRFTGMAGYYRKNVKDFALIAEPLTRLSRKDIPFVWSNEQQQSFEAIKGILSSYPVLGFPDYTQPWYITTDASKVGVGAVLMQKKADDYVVIAYFSKPFSRADQNKAPVEQELIAILEAFRNFRPYVIMSKVFLQTDHKPLTYLRQKAQVNSRLARYLVELQQYDIEISHIDGSSNKVADALSRAFEDLPAEFFDEVPDTEDNLDFPICFACHQPESDEQASGLRSWSIQESQAQDTTLAITLKILREEPLDQEEADNDNALWYAENAILREGTLCRPLNNSSTTEETPARLIIPDNLKRVLFDAHHSSPLGGGHLSAKKTYKKVAQKYFWKGMFADITMWSKQCHQCQSRNSPHPAFHIPLRPVRNTTVFARVGIDICGRFPTTPDANKYVLNCICLFTKYVVSVPIPDMRTVTLARAFVKHFVLIYSCPTMIVTDNQTSFTSEFFEELLQMLGIDHRRTTPYHSEGNGCCERSFRTFSDMLSKYVNKAHTDWDRWLTFVSYSYNLTPHSTTGETPHFLVYGRDAVYPVDLALNTKTYDKIIAEETDVTTFRKQLLFALRSSWEFAASAATKAAELMKRSADSNVRLPPLEVGSLVMLKRSQVEPGHSSKLHLSWKGIYRVLELEEQHALIVSCEAPQSKPKRVHLNQVKPYYGMPGPVCTRLRLRETERADLEQAGATDIGGTVGYEHEPRRDVVDESQPTHHYNLRPRNRVRFVA